MAQGIGKALFTPNFDSAASITGTLTKQFNKQNFDSEGYVENPVFIVSIMAVNTGGAPGVTTVNYNGVAMTLATSDSQAGAGVRLTAYTYYMLEADMPTAAGLYDLDLVLTGTGIEVAVVGGMFKNASQVAPTLTDTYTAASSTTITLDNDKATTYMFHGTYAARESQTGTFVYNQSQDEIGLQGTTASRLGATYDDSIASIASSFTAIWDGAADKQIGVGTTWIDEPATQVAFATTVAATSIITSGITHLEFQAATVAAVSTVNPNQFVYLRTFDTTIAAQSALVTNLNRAAALLSTTNVVSTVTAQPLERAADMATVVEVIATPSGIFNATRPLMSTTTAVADITASFGNTFDENISSLTPGCYIELFEIDTSTIPGGGQVFRFIPGGYDVANVFWQGNEYTRFPIVVDGFEWNATSQAPPQPELTLSNVNKFVLSAVITLGDLVGAKVTRWRTYEQYLDGQEQADQNAHFPPDIYFVQQKTSHTKDNIAWVLSSALDLPGIRLPKRQILRDETTGNVYAPGVSQVRFKGR